MSWTYLNGKKIGIWGMGREGRSAKSILIKHTQKTTLIEISEENKADIFSCDVLIKSPGVSFYRPEIQEALKKHILITSGTNLFFENKNPQTFVIAVTGTKGKSTTSSLLAHTLKTLGKSVNLGGNIGEPLINFVDQKTDFLVAELSSYQCADLNGHPNIGVITNLYPEHLQWHGTHEQYYQDKLHLINQSEQVILNGNDQRLKKYLSDGDNTSFNTPEAIHVQGEYFYDRHMPLFPLSKLNLLGIHNAENACAVLTVIKLLGLPLLKCAHAFQTFQPLPHRLQILGTKAGLTYVDDSISTTPETAVAALKALDKGQDITLIAGGFDRGQDYTELIRFMAKYKNRFRLVTLPDTGKRLSELSQKAGIETSLTSEMPTAVNIAEHITPPHGIILLSPAAPSYNLYQNFEERGNDFKHWAGFKD